MPKKPPSSKPPKREQSTWNASGFNYSGAAWIRLRNLKRQISPLCELCLKRGVLTPFHTIDHIKSILDGGEPYTNKDGILIRTLDKYSPFVDIVNGLLWGDNLAPYTFLILDEKKI